MFRRFAAASAIAAMGIAVADSVLLLTPGLSLQRTYPLPAFWCMAPLVWGLWAMLAPAAWVPRRLPPWGAILGLIAGLLAMFVLNLPSQILGEAVPVLHRGIAVLVLVVVYYLLWLLVRIAHRALAAPSSSAVSL